MRTQAKEEEEEDQADEAELRIAWQYRRYIEARQKQQEAAEAAERSGKELSFSVFIPTYMLRSTSCVCRILASVESLRDCVFTLVYNPEFPSPVFTYPFLYITAAKFRRAGASSSSSSSSASKGATSATWCHSFDLTKSMGEEYLKQKGGTMVRTSRHARASLASSCLVFCSFLLPLDPIKRSFNCLLLRFFHFYS
jgi:hypothetical protein